MEHTTEMNPALQYPTRMVPRFSANPQPDAQPLVTTRNTPQSNPPAKDQAKTEPGKERRFLPDFSRMFGQILEWTTGLWAPDEQTRCKRAFMDKERAIVKKYAEQARELPASLNRIHGQIQEEKHQLELLQGLYDRFERQIAYQQLQMATPQQELDAQKAALKAARQQLKTIEESLHKETNLLQKEGLSGLLKASRQKALTLLDPVLIPEGKTIEALAEQGDSLLISQLLDQQEARFPEKEQQIADWLAANKDRGIGHMRDYQKHYTEEMEQRRKTLAKLEEAFRETDQAISRLDAEKTKALELAKEEYQQELNKILAVQNQSQKPQEPPVA